MTAAWVAAEGCVERFPVPPSIPDMLIWAQRHYIPLVAEALAQFAQDETSRADVAQGLCIQMGAILEALVTGPVRGVLSVPGEQRILGLLADPRAVALGEQWRTLTALEQLVAATAKAAEEGEEISRGDWQAIRDALQACQTAREP